MAPNSTNSNSNSGSGSNSAAYAIINRALLDPPQWGWSAGGKVTNVMTPQEALRRRRRKERNNQMRRSSSSALSSSNTKKSPKSSSSTSSSTLSMASPLATATNKTTTKKGMNPAPSTTNTTTTPSIGISPSSHVTSPTNNNTHNTHNTTAHVLNPGMGMAIKTPRTKASWQVMTTTPTTTTTITTNTTTGATTISNTSSSNDVAVVPLPDAASATPTMTTPNPTTPAVGTIATNPSVTTPVKPVTPSITTTTATGITTQTAATTATSAAKKSPPTPPLCTSLVRGEKGYVVQAISRNNICMSVGAAFAKNDKDSASAEENLVLDMYTYHCGREGMEMGDELEATDSGSQTWHGGCRKKFMVDISFPIGDSDDGVEVWKEQVEWDIVSMEPPIVFATNVAQQFGLDFGATMELCNSIQYQIDSHRGDSAYPETPVSLIDPSTGTSRSGLGKARPCHLYASSTGPGGMPMQPFKRKPKPKTASTSSSAAAGTGGASGGARSTGAARTSSSSSSLRQESYTFKSSQAVRDEVLARARKECSFSAPNVLLQWNHVCHLCRTKKQQGAMFPCLIQQHVYCADHFKSELQIDLTQKSASTTTLSAAGSSPAVDYCPICCVSCSCNKCQRRLDQVAGELQKRTPAGTSPSNTKFDDILLYCAGKQQTNRRATTAGGGGGSGGTKSYVDKLKSVPKVPPHFFPREMCGSRDLEPGDDRDYRTMFTPQGAFLVQESVAAAANGVLEDAAPPIPQEDGNVDFCNSCRAAGDLVCCDYCPRAFHQACIVGGKVHPEEGSKWECPTCIQEKAGLPEDTVKGKAKYKDTDKTCLEVICEAFVKTTAAPQDQHAYLEAMLVLSMILEMLLQLMEYDFGYMFDEPVDVNAIPEYSLVVKNPMDLGTIADRLVNGHYAKLYDEEAKKDLNIVIAQVLKDVEQVWHNCFMFNFEGSSIYRMAEVHARRSRNIRKTSFDKLLKDDTKRLVDEFLAACDAERAPIIAKASNPDAKPQTKRKISVPYAPGGKCRIVAVFDPDTNLVVKLYTTLKSAVMAGYYLSSLGHQSEWTPISDYTIKNCIKRCKDDPKLTLFGYRWVFYDELRTGDIVFGPESSAAENSSTWAPQGFDNHMIQLIHNETTYLFLSIAEAVSFSELPRDANLADLRRRLEEMSFDQWIPLLGFRFRKLSHQSGSQAYLVGDVMKDTPGHVAIVKQDFVTGRRLMGFDSVKAAHEDWCRERTTSPMLRKKGYSMEFFKKDYLNGGKKVDGLIWRALSKQEKLKLKQEEAIAATETYLGKRSLTDAAAVSSDATIPPAKKQAIDPKAKEADATKTPK